jgi:peptide chain release factor subunit 3
MSRLNAGAFEFVPGKAFKLPQDPAQPLPEPVERPEQAEAPAPPPTITLNIGGSRSPPVPSTANPVAQAHLPTPKASTTAKATSSSGSPAPPAPKVVTTEKIRSDIVAHDIHAVDDSVVNDLYGEGEGSQLVQPPRSIADPVAGKGHLNIVFIGHVDAGKSTMGGNLLYMTGTVDKRTMEKYEREAKEAGRESWYLSWALDSTPQERLKGKTVEVGRAYFETSLRRYTILDAPGHKTFVPSMISGAAQADVAILVISARKGEFETGFERGGQTREHIMLVKTAGVSKVVIVINKMDDTTVQWQKARYDEIKDKLTPFVKAAGFNPKTDTNFVPVSAYTGLNLKDRVPKSVCSWWECVGIFLPALKSS